MQENNEKRRFLLQKVIWQDVDYQGLLNQMFLFPIAMIEQNFKPIWVGFNSSRKNHVIIGFNKNKIPQTLCKLSLADLLVDSWFKNCKNCEKKVEKQKLTVSTLYDKK